MLVQTHSSEPPLAARLLAAAPVAPFDLVASGIARALCICSLSTRLQLALGLSTSATVFLVPACGLVAQSVSWLRLRCAAPEAR
jgi:hypothetical protein